MPRVSVIIPSYNRAAYVAHAIRSVLNQSFSDFEVIIVDDGSQDGTESVVNQIQDPRIRYVYQENAGLSAARNTGIHLALGDYLAFLDSDDTFLPEKLAFQVGQMDAQPQLGLVAGGYQYIDETGRILSERYPWKSRPSLGLEDILYGVPIIVNAVLLRTDWVRRVGGFDPQLRRVEDFDLWLRLAVLGCPMAWSPILTCAYRMHLGQMVREATRQNQITLQVYEKLFQREDLPKGVRQLHDKVMASVNVSAAGRAIGAGEVQEAQAFLLRAVELNPALLQGEIPGILFSLISWANEPISGNPIQFVQRLFASLPESLSILRKFSGYFTVYTAIWASLESLQAGSSKQAEDYLSSTCQDNPGLWGDQNQWETILVETVAYFDFDVQLQLLKRWLTLLQDSCQVEVTHRGKLLAKWFRMNAFDLAREGDLSRAGPLMQQGVWYDPAWLTNRGVLSVLVRYYLQKVSFLRKM